MVIDTIALAKIDVYNTKMLNNEDIKEILNPQQEPVIIADSMDICVFKIALHKELVIIYININN